MRKKKQKYSMSEVQRLLCRWTMELASYLMEEYGMEKKAALEKAHLNRNLIMYLGDGVVEFIYEKEDGSERLAHGTLCKGISKSFDGYEFVESKEMPMVWPREDFTYWDLDREAFRTFKASRLLKIKAHSVVNCIHDKVEKLRNRKVEK